MPLNNAGGVIFKKDSNDKKNQKLYKTAGKEQRC